MDMDQTALGAKIVLKFFFSSLFVSATIFLLAILALLHMQKSKRLKLYLVENEYHPNRAEVCAETFDHDFE